jgi:ribosome-binding protein aMBF1 (putative translation factor)
MTRHNLRKKNKATTFTIAMRKARKQARLTLLDMMQMTGIAVHILSDVERGIITPESDVASAIRSCLEMREIEEGLEKLVAQSGRKDRTYE